MDAVRLYLSWLAAAGAEIAATLAVTLEEASRRLDPGTTPRWFRDAGFTDEDYELAQTLLACLPDPDPT